MSRRLYLLSDSLSLPRPAAAGSDPIDYRQTYPWLVREDAWFREQGFDLIPNGRRERTMDEGALLFSNQVQHYQPDALVVQIGIVDCAPRIFRRWQRVIVGMLRPRILQRVILKLVRIWRRPLLRFSLRKVYTSKARFSASARQISQSCAEQGIALCFVGIAPAPDDYCEKSPGIDRNISEYNAILAEVADHFIDLAALMGDDPSAYLLSDGHHLNEGGNRLVADQIVGWLQKTDLRKNHDPDN